MADTVKIKMGDYQQRQAIGYLQEVILKAKKDRGDQEPEMLEMQIYYLLSELDAIPGSYTADWPTELAK
ncbi:MAG TPA: hypothetical protein VGQ59_15865 [Cyclobacteriaceae bacterium]|jgi:hypothetical protein|nr:hypothetical protein [Cyclobacteriaceae bacterium]